MVTGFSNKDWALIALVILTWGANACAIKVGTNEISPHLLVFLRGFLTALMALPLIQKITQEDFKNLCLVGIVFFALHYTVMYLSINAINSSSFVVLVMLAMPISILLSVFLYKEKIGIWTCIGMLICFIGLVVAFGLPDITQYPIGAFLTIMTAILWAIGSLLMKRTKHIPLMTFTFYTFAIAVPFFALAVLIFEPISVFQFEKVNYLNLGLSVGYQVVIMGVMAGVWGYLIGNHPAAHVTPFLLLQVPVAAIAGYFILDEQLSGDFFISAFLIMGGVALIHYRRLKQYEPQN
jgi:O-acetylserine/cysteine efflux transporter